MRIKRDFARFACHRAILQMSICKSVHSFSQRASKNTKIEEGVKSLEQSYLCYMIIANHILSNISVYHTFTLTFTVL